MFQLEGYPQRTQWGGPEDGVIDPGGQGVIVSTTTPSYLPTLAILDLHLERVFKLGGTKKAHLVVDCFNVLNSAAPEDIDIQFEWGKVTSIPSPRRFRGGVRFEF